MKKIACVAVLIAAANTAIAKPNFYIGASSGVLEVSSPGYSSEMPASILAGLQVNDFFSIEGEYTFADLLYEERFYSVNTEVTSLSFFGVARTPGQVYAMGKVGIAAVEENIGGDEIFSSTELQYGAGGGFRVSEALSIEAEYTILHENVDFMSIGVNYSLSM